MLSLLLACSHFDYIVHGTKYIKTVSWALRCVDMLYVMRWYVIYVSFEKNYTSLGNKRGGFFCLYLLYFTQVSRDPCCRSFSHAAGDESSHENELPRSSIYQFYSTGTIFSWEQLNQCKKHCIQCNALSLLLGRERIYLGNTHTHLTQIISDIQTKEIFRRYPSLLSLSLSVSLLHTYT